MKKITTILLISLALLACQVEARDLLGGGAKVNKEGQLSTSDYLFEIAKGNVPGYSWINKFGENPDVDTGSYPEDVWDFGGLYTYTANTGATYYFSSSNATDTQLFRFTVQTVDSKGNWNEETFDQQIAGQTKTQLNPTSGDPVVRIYRIENEGDEGEDLVGIFYVYEDDTVSAGVPDTDSKVRAQVNDGNNQTEMLQYTIPTGKVGFVFQILAGQSRSQAAGASVLTLRTRRYGKLFKVKGRIATVNSGSSNYQNKLSVPAPLPSRTDINPRIEMVSANNTGIYGIYDIILVDEDKFSDAYLTAIGQVKRVP